MAYYTNRLVQGVIALDARRVWDRFTEEMPYAFCIPVMELPLVVVFHRCPVRRFIVFNETRPRKEAGLEMCLMFLPPEQAPARWRVPLRPALGRAEHGGDVLIFSVMPVAGEMRPGRKRELLAALYVVAAFDKGWRAGDIEPGPREVPARVPLLHLDGPPEDPSYQMTSILVKRHTDRGLRKGGGSS